MPINPGARPAQSTMIAACTQLGLPEYTAAAGAFDTATWLDADAAWFAMDLTTSGYVPAVVAGGICALICPGLVMNSGSATLFSGTQVPPRISGRGAGGCHAL